MSHHSGYISSIGLESGNSPNSFFYYLTLDIRINSLKTLKKRKVPSPIFFQPKRKCILGHLLIPQKLSRNPFRRISCATLFSYDLRITIKISLSQTVPVSLSLSSTLTFGKYFLDCLSFVLGKNEKESLKEKEKHQMGWTHQINFCFKVFILDMEIKNIFNFYSNWNKCHVFDNLNWCTIILSMESAMVWRERVSEMRWMMTHPIEKSTNTEMFIGRTSALYIIETWIKVGTNEGDQRFGTSWL